MDERFARVVRLDLAEHLDPARGDHPAWASSPAAAAVASHARHRAGPGRYWLLVAAAIAAVTLATTILLAGGFRLPDLPTPPWLLSESPTPTMPDASPEPTPFDAPSTPQPVADPSIFSWARDDPSEWVTEAELTEAVAAMAIRGIFPAPLDGEVEWGNFFGGWHFRFRLVDDAEPWHLGISSVKSGYGGPPTATDPRLPDGVTYEAECWRCHASYILSGPYSDELLVLDLRHGEDSWRDVDVSDAAYKARVFALGSMMLIEMGWADGTAADPGVFSWSRDALSEWVTEAELTEAIAAMATRGTFPAPLDGAVTLGGFVGLQLNFRLVDDAEPWRLSISSEQSGYAGPPTATDPRLPDGVTYEAECWRCYGSYILSGPYSDELLAITLFPPGVSSWRDLDVSDAAYKARVFALASTMLVEMGWAEGSAGDPSTFSWSRDDLGDWVTEAELTEAIAAMSMQRPFGADLDGTVQAECTAKNDATGRDGQECAWAFRLAGDTESWGIVVHNGDHEGNGVPDGGPWRTHSWLPEGATYAQGEGFAYASFLFSGPGSEESICIALVPPGVAPGDLDTSEVGYKARVFDLASMMLQEFGWAEGSAEGSAEDSDVFSWARDDLGEWLTADEVAGELAAMSIRQPSLAPLDGAVMADCTRGECGWGFRLVGDPSSWHLRAHAHHGAGDQWEATWGPFQRSLMTDPLLPAGATWGRAPGVSSLQFSGPNSNQSICITLGHAGEYFDDLGEADFRARYFALASMILRELGWAD